MTIDCPRVSIGLPVYNGERYLRASIESVLRQTYTDLELIVADNASTDSSLAITEEYAATDPRVRVLRSEVNRGAAWNFNRTVDAARGQLFRWAAADDLIEPTYLERCIELLEDDPSAVLAHSRTVEIDADGTPIDRPQVVLPLDADEPWLRYGELVANKHMCFPVFGLMRTEVLRDTGLIGSYSDSDRVLLAELALRGPFRSTDEPLFLNRDHAERSVRAYSTSRERAAWFNPEARDALSFPSWRQGYEFTRAALRAPVPLDTKLRSIGQMRRWLQWSWLWLLRNLVRGGWTIAARSGASLRRSRLGRARSDGV